MYSCWFKDTVHSDLFMISVFVHAFLHFCSCSAWKTEVDELGTSGLVIVLSPMAVGLATRLSLAHVVRFTYPRLLVMEIMRIKKIIFLFSSFNQSCINNLKKSW